MLGTLVRDGNLHISSSILRHVGNVVATCQIKLASSLFTSVDVVGLIDVFDKTSIAVANRNSSLAE